MPWNPLGIWTNAEDADEARQYARYQAEMQAQETQEQRNRVIQEAAMQQPMARLANMNQPAFGRQENVGLAQQGYADNPWGAQAGLAARQEQRHHEPPNWLGVLEEFNDAFQNGIKEIVLAEHIYYELMQYFNRQRRYIDALEHPVGDHLILNTAGGIMKIIKEGDISFKDIDFDKYMEEI